MKHFSIVVLFFVLVMQMGTALSAELSSNIMRRVNAANLSLDKVDVMIKENRAEHSGRHLRSAQLEYDNIYKYYGTSFDHEHPTLVALKARIETLSARAENAKNKPAAVSTQSGPVVSQPVVKSQITPTKTDESKQLLSNVRRLIGITNGMLDQVNKDIAKGHKTDYNLERAKSEYAKIFKRYTGMFDPEHPDVLALKARIDKVEQEAEAASMARMGTKPVESGHTIVGMSQPMGKQLRQIGVHLATLDRVLADARKAEASAARHSSGSARLSPLANQAPLVKREAEKINSLFATFNQDFADQYKANHPAYVQVSNRVTKANKDVSEFMTDLDTEARGVQKQATDKYQAKVKAIMSKYKNQAPSGKLHAANPGRMVWANQEISMGSQDNIRTRDTFKLTDPVFGRVFLHQSLGNTPVYSSGGGSPSENYQFRFEFRLFIDGKEVADKFGVFKSSKLNGKAGESWTTWQFAPNPVPFDDAFKAEADAWRKVTRGLQPGKHQIRFELWGTQGQFRTLEPVSVGEFTLIVEAGERIAAGTSFPGDVRSSGDTNDIRTDMRKAVIASGAENPLKIAVTSDWQQGVYSDSKRRYRTISGAMLWNDKDGDGVCRFTTYNFVANHLGGNNWSPLKFKSFCLSCPEGDVECTK